jgi:hypothetical protein
LFSASGFAAKVNSTKFAVHAMLKADERGRVPLAVIVVSRANFSCTLLAIQLAILRNIENILGGNKL